MPLVKMKELLRKTNCTYAVGAFNVSDMEMAMGAIRAVEELQAPIILQIAESRLAYSPLELLGPLMLGAAKGCSVPVAVHLDHGTTLETIQLALYLGFTSVMYDGSHYPLAENIARTREVVALAHQYGAEVEGEIGHIGGAEATEKSMDVLVTGVAEAQCFLRETGVDALAIAIGTVHGNYRGKPSLRIDRLRDIAKVVNCPLVLHGGTGLTKRDFHQCLTNGISKINIATASYDGAARNLQAIRKGNFFDYSQAIVQGTYENVKKHILLFGTQNKA
jgi:fructose-bisphosphate aldolase class II